MFIFSVYCIMIVAVLLAIGGIWCAIQDSKRESHLERENERLKKDLLYLQFFEETES